MNTEKIFAALADLETHTAATMPEVAKMWPVEMRNAVFYQRLHAATQIYFAQEVAEAIHGASLVARVAEKLGIRS